MELKVFNNDTFGQVRTITIDDEPWFVGKDVATILGYSNTKKALLDHVNNEDKQLIQRSHFVTLEVPNRGMTVINESGVYSLILSSKLPKAREFKHWITSEVIPSIRKHGAYMTDQTLEQALTSPDFLIRLATELKSEQEKRKSLEVKVAQDQPKVLLAESISGSKDTISVASLAKIIKQNGVKNIGQNRLFAWLRENGYLSKREGRDWNMPTQRAMELGLFRIKEVPICKNGGLVSIEKTVLVTGRGQEYFVNAFLNR